MRRLWVGVVMAAAPVLSQYSAPPASDLAAGRRTYESNCIQCHGADGDALGYADIVPIAGIGRRYPAGVIGRLTGAFSGRVFHGKDRDQLVAYMSSLPGAKGLPDPGWLMMPHLLENKAPRMTEFRVIDVRGGGAYAQGHIPNAVSAESGDCLAEVVETGALLGRLGVSRDMLVVIYDESGGPAAACLWWRIRQAGHPWLAVLDGGWNRWRAEGRASTTTVPKFAPVSYQLRRRIARDITPEPVSSLSLPDGWMWQQTLDSNGFRSGRQLAALAEKAALQPGSAVRVLGAGDEVAHLVLVLHLLGYQVNLDVAASVLWLGPQGPAPSN